MGLFDFIKGELINVIEWKDDSNNRIVYNFPIQEKEIKMGAQLIVRESQIAVFINEGKIADIYKPGRHELTTANMPLLTTLKSWKYGFNSPFKCDIYFINTKQFTNQKWGTTNPIMMRDTDFGILRLRGFGIFAYKVSNPSVFLKELFGTQASFETEEIHDHLKRILLSGLTDLLGESKIPAMDLASNYDEIGAATLQKMNPEFEKLGLCLTNFIIENLSLPDEVEKAIDQRSRMSALGDVNTYTKFQAADAIRDAAQNEGGGMANAGVGLGAGAALGQMMGQAFQNTPNQTPSSSNINCTSCNKPMDSNAKFCPHCGESAKKTMSCSNCNSNIPNNSKFCPECGFKIESKSFCNNCGKPMDSNAKFCPHCGEAK